MSKENTGWGEIHSFAPENKAKILAKWWDLPPTVGQIF
jgi:hypothetical protein